MLESSDFLFFFGRVGAEGAGSVPRIAVRAEQGSAGLGALPVCAAPRALPRSPSSSLRSRDVSYGGVSSCPVLAGTQNACPQAVCGVPSSCRASSPSSCRNVLGCGFEAAASSSQPRNSKPKALRGAGASFNLLARGWSGSWSLLRCPRTLDFGGKGFSCRPFLQLEQQGQAVRCSRPQRAKCGRDLAAPPLLPRAPGVTAAARLGQNLRALPFSSSPPSPPVSLGWLQEPWWPRCGVPKAVSPRRAGTWPGSSPAAGCPRSFGALPASRGCFCLPNGFEISLSPRSGPAGMRKWLLILGGGWRKKSPGSLSGWRMCRR